MARESSFWKWLRGHLAPLGHFTRIESEISPGVPDVYFSLKTLGKYDGWIELKSISAPKTDRAKPLKRKGLNSDQVDWISSHWKEGVRIYIFVKIGGYIYVFMGASARRLNDYTYGEIKAFSDWTIKQRISKCEIQSDLISVLTHDRAAPTSSLSSASGSRPKIIIKRLR